MTRLLGDVAGLDFEALPGVNYEAQVTVTPPPAAPQDRRLIEATVVVQSIAAAPARLNLVISGEPSATANLVRFLLQAEAVTGQVIAADPGDPSLRSTDSKARP